MQKFGCFDDQPQARRSQLPWYVEDPVKPTGELSEEARRLNQELFMSCNLSRPPQLADDLVYPNFHSTPTSPSTRALRLYGPAPTPSSNNFGIFSTPISPNPQMASFTGPNSIGFRHEQLDTSLTSWFHQPIVQEEFGPNYFQPMPNQEHAISFPQGPIYPTHGLPNQFSENDHGFQVDGEVPSYFPHRFGSFGTEISPNSALNGNTCQWLDGSQDGALNAKTGSLVRGFVAPEPIYHREGSVSDPSQPVLEKVKSKFKLKVTGVPLNGARSRVETQIKLCLKLVATDNSSLPLWSFIRLPYFMTVGERGKRTIKGSIRAISEDQVLNLRVWVVCATDAKRGVKVCNGCIHRERKRQTRRSTQEPNANYACIPIDDVETVDREQLKIVVFNCSKLLDFHSGDVILPTRLTCYCRHHQESVGFVIKFAAFDHKGSLVASGKSPPIMITDDHKTRSKLNQFQQGFGGLPHRRSSQSPLKLNLALAELLPQRLTHNSPEPSPVNLPFIAHIVPSHGPIRGGCEIAILGEYFNESMSVYFGDLSSPVRVLSPHSAVCLLPPADRPASVLVSVRQAERITPPGNLLFTYGTAPEVQRLEAALRFLNYQATGLVKDHEEIAAHVLGEAQFE